MNIKICIILTFIILFLIFLYLRKNDKINFLKNNILTNRIENFQNLCNRDINYKCLTKDDIEKFRKNILNTDTLIDISINNPDYSYPSLRVIDNIYINRDNINEEKKTFLFGPGGICFDEKNDDLIIFDIYKLLRYQTRPKRNEAGLLTYRGLDELEEFDFKEVKSYELENREKLILIINGFFKKVEPNKSPINKVISVVNDNKILKYITDINNKILNLPKNFKLIVTEATDEEIEAEIDEDSKLIETIAFENKEQFITEFNILAQYFKNIYYKKQKCFYDAFNGENTCSIEYQRDLPAFDLGSEGKGIQALQFDNNPTTFYHVSRVNDTTRPINNSWTQKSNKGKFSISISKPEDKITGKNDFYESSDVDDGMKLAKIKLNGNYHNVEEFTGGVVNVKNIRGDDEIKGFSKLPDEYENIGVGLLYNKDLECVFVPDVLNNRIQIFYCYDKDFQFVGQFGNLDFITHRSFPTYTGDGEGDSNPLLNATMSYEPIYDTTESNSVKQNDQIQTNGYKCKDICEDKGKCSDIVKARGGFAYDGREEIFHIPDNNSKQQENPSDNECDRNYSIKRMNIHWRDEKLNGGGHFYSLFQEYNRVLSKELKKDSLLYNNPFHIGDSVTLKDTDVKFNAISQGTLAYRKVLLKAIKEADEGQRFGQLFKPKSIAFDDDMVTAGGQKYYVVDTYHHCIQCYYQGNNIQTTDGEELSFVSADEELNNDKDLYFYDEKWQSDKLRDYNKSKLYSLGVRQKLIGFENEIFDENTDLNQAWAINYGQHIQVQGMTGDLKYGVVKLYRWTSGNTSYCNTTYSNLSTDFDYNKIDENHKFFKSELNTDLESEEFMPGLGEFSYPSDIVITRDPFTKQKLLMVSDMGNNRVCIFKKYLINYRGSQHYRFRFYRFLNDQKEIELTAPLSITVSHNTGRVYVLNGNYYAGQTISVFEPTVKDDKLKYLKHNEITINSVIKAEIGIKKKLVRAVKIRIDDRGILAISDMNNNCVHITGEYLKKTNITTDLVDTSKIRTEINFNNIIFHMNFDKFINKLIEDKNNIELFPPSMNRFRLVIIRKDISNNNDKEDLLLSREFKLDLNLKTDKAIIGNLKNYSFKDTFSFDQYEDYWTTYKYGERMKMLDIDVENFTSNKIEINNSKPNLDISKNYQTIDMDGNKVKVLEGYEDWIGKGMYPNSTYLYQFGIYNYINYIHLLDKPIELTTIPLHIDPSSIIKINETDNKENYIRFILRYGLINPLYYVTQNFNPICYYIFRKKHNRTKDVSLKYLNVSKGEMIQLILPEDSKFYFSKLSKPKFGKLYVYNLYKNGDVREQKEYMKENYVYKDSKLILFYSAEGGFRQDGGYNIPDKNSLDGEEYIDDFFFLGDDPKNMYKQIKFRVRINIRNKSDKIIKFDNLEEIDKNLEYYSEEKGKLNDNSMILLDKVSGVLDNNGKYKYFGELEYCDKGISGNPILPNQTYEYLVLIGNQNKLNPAGNSFYYTTKPSKPLLKTIKFEKHVEDGKDKTFLKIIWYTSKNNGIYWPYNFLVLRRNKKDTKTLKPKKSEGIEELGKKFTNDNGNIRLKEDVKENYATYKHDFKNIEFGNWKLTFLIDNLNSVKSVERDDKKDGQVSRTVEKTSRKYKFDNEMNNPKKEYNLKASNKIEIRGIGGNLQLEIELFKGETLRNNKLEETVIPPTKGTIGNQFDAEQDKINEEKDKLLEAWKKVESEEDRNNIFKEMERRRQMKQIGAIFNLDDDYDGDNNGVVNNYSGYGGELFRYLKAQEKVDLLKIFDDLHDKLKVLHGDVTMRMDGPGGMMRSGDKDMLIDKIRHLAYLYRKGNKSAGEKLGIECKPKTTANLLQDLVNDKPNCMSTAFKKEIAEKEQKRIKEKTKLQKEFEEKKKQRKILNHNMTVLIKQIEGASKEKKDKYNKALKEQQKLIDEINRKELELKNKMEKLRIQNELLEEERKLGKDKIDDATNKIPDSFKPENLKTLQNTYGSLNITNVLNNRDYRGNYGSFYDFGEKITDIELDVFLKDLNFAYDKDSDIRSEFSQIRNVLYDFDRKELYFVFPGENVVDNMEKTVFKSNSIILFFDSQLETTSEEQKKKNELKNQKLLDELQTQMKEMEAAMRKIGTVDDPEMERLKLLQKEIKANKDLNLSEWSVFKDGKEKIVEQLNSGKDLEKIIDEYSIVPTLASLSGNIVKGKDLYPDSLKSIRDNELRLMKEEEEFIGHKQMIEVGNTDKNKKYEYCVLSYISGFSFNEEYKRNFMGIESNKVEESNYKFPHFGLGEVHSDVITYGEDIEPSPEVTVPNEVKAEYIFEAQKTEEPIIEFFEPKKGLQNSVVKIVGTSLDKLEYICFRDVKVDIIKKNKRRITKGDVNEIYDEYLVRVPTLKKLNKECWQSLRPYNVLVWGYHRKTGKQIRSGEGDDKLMFTYMDRVKCPDNQKLDIPN